MKNTVISLIISAVHVNNFKKISLQQGVICVKIIYNYLRRSRASISFHSFFRILTRARNFVRKRAISSKDSINFRRGSNCCEKNSRASTFSKCYTQILSDSLRLMDTLLLLA